MPFNALPNKISEYVYNYIYQDKRDIVNKYYKKEDGTGEFVINVNKMSVPPNEVETLT